MVFLALLEEFGQSGEGHMTLGRVISGEWAAPVLEDYEDG